MVSAVIKSFKHDGSSHRMWMYLSLLKEDDDYYYLAGEKTKVIEHDGREWRAPEGAVYILSKKRFFNVIVMFRSMSEVEYYVNMASPTIKESDSVFSFVDYDLDLKKESDGHVKEIDLGEYAHNRSVYGYSEKLCFVLEKSFKEIEQMMNESAFPFDDKKNIQMYNLYLKELHESKSL
jgi:uncharacterized protein